MKFFKFAIISILPVLLFCKSTEKNNMNGKTVCFWPKNNAPVGLQITFKAKSFTGFHLSPMAKDPISGVLIKKTKIEYVYKSKLYNMKKTLQFIPHKKLLLITPPNNEDSIWAMETCSQVLKEFK